MRHTFHIGVLKETKKQRTANHASSCAEWIFLGFWKRSFVADLSADLCTEASAKVEALAKVETLHEFHLKMGWHSQCHWLARGFIPTL